MSTIDDQDKFIIQRGLTTYQLPASDMSTIQDDDLLLVARGSDHFKVSGADVLGQLGGDDGVWVDDVRVRDGSNGLPISQFGLADASGAVVDPPEGTTWDQFCRNLPTWDVSPKGSSTRSAIGLSQPSGCPGELQIQLDIRNCLNKRLDINFSSYWSWHANAGINPKNVSFRAYSHDDSLIDVRTSFQTQQSKNTTYKYTAQWLLTKESYDSLLLTFQMSGGNTQYQTRENLCINYWALVDPSPQARQERRQERREERRALN